MRKRLCAGLARAGLVWIAGLVLVLAAAPAQAQGPNRAALVVQYGEGAVETYCVSFAGPQISGLDLLLGAGLDVVYASMGLGAMVCQIGDTGCPDPGRCLCACRGAGCVYWSYWHLVDGTWQYAAQGASMYAVKPGAVEGWVWGAGSISQATPPPPIRFEDVCRDETPAPRPAAPSSPTPLPTLGEGRPVAPSPPTPLPTSGEGSAPSPPTPLPTLGEGGLAMPPTATAEVTEMPGPALSPTVTSATPTPQTPGAAGMSSYLAFGVLAVLLVVAGLLVRRRL